MALRAGKLLGKAVFYFNEGRGLVSLAVSLCNTVGIWYALLGFSRLMADVLLFASLFIPAYLVSCTLIGYLYARRGPYRGAIEARVRLNPYFRDLARALMLICEGRCDEAREVLRRWS